MPTRRTAVGLRGASAHRLTERDSMPRRLRLHELGFGLGRLPPGARRGAFRAVLTAFVAEYEDRILPLDRIATTWAARFRAERHRSGRVLDLGDVLIAGTARAHDLSIATRNVRDFERLDIEVTNPREI